MSAIPCHRRRAVLVVEDDEALASVLIRGLCLAGHEVELVTDGDSAERRWRSGTWDLVILDIMLPGRDGIDLCAAMRSIGDSTPVLLRTARDDPASRLAGLAAGASAYLTKPYAYAELLATLERLMDPRPGTDIRFLGPSR